MSGLPLTVTAVSLHERGVTLRLPFRFGVVTLREAQQAFVRVRVRLDDGREAWGMAAELMVPKWFDKRPETSNEQNVMHLRLALDRARRAYLAEGRTESAFGLFESLYPGLVEECGPDLNPLAAQFGPAQLDKAVLDGLCRAAGLSFTTALRANLPGIRVGPLTPGLEEFDMPGFLAGLALPSSVCARHTVGMLDPLVAADRGAESALDDGLPETLQDVIRDYGNTCFKLKLGGDPDSDHARLRAIAAVLDTLPTPYLVTLDGNEQFDSAEAVVALWRRLAADPALDRLLAATVLVEQPIHRSAAADQPVDALARRVPVIIDESDATLGAFPRARDLGYDGVSSKACKGIYKSILNAARCVAWNRAQGEPRYFLSGEDLTCQAGLAVQQDLALVGALGIPHVERNGHHYVHGMDGAGEAEQRAFVEAHPDLYGAIRGRACLRLRNGHISLDSLNTTGFASAAVPDWEALPEMRFNERVPTQ